MSAVQTPASSPILPVLNCPASTDRQTAAHLQGRPALPSVAVLSGQCSKRLAPAFSHWPNEASAVAAGGTCHFPGALQQRLLHWDGVGECKGHNASWHGHLLAKTRPWSAGELGEHQDKPSAPLCSSSSTEGFRENFSGDFTHRPGNGQPSVSTENRVG